MSQDQNQVYLPPITFFADGPDEGTRNANLEAVLPSPGFAEAAILIADAIAKNVDYVLLDYTSEAVNIRYQIDSVWHAMPSKDRQSGDYMLATLKKLSNLNYRERRARQEGEFGAKFHGRTFACQLISQGVKTGERVAIRLKDPKKKFDGLADLGMRPRLIERTKELLSLPSGLVLLSSLPGDGSSTTWNHALNSVDRFMRDFFAVESAAEPEDEVINIETVTYDRSKGQTAETPLPQLLLREPQVLCFTEPMSTPKMVDVMSELVLEKELLVVARVHSRSAIEALLRVLVLKPNVERFAQALRGVIYSRTYRTLCPQCKQPYQPPPQLLQKIGIAPGRVETFYREFQPPPPEELIDEKGNPIPFEPCPNCHGIGYRGRSAFFEVLTVSDAIRKTLSNKPSVTSVTEAAAAEGHVSLREEGIVHVAKGNTSISELQRVLKK